MKVSQIMRMGVVSFREISQNHPHVINVLTYKQINKSFCGNLLN